MNTGGYSPIIRVVLAFRDNYETKTNPNHCLQPPCYHATPRMILSTKDIRRLWYHMAAQFSIKQLMGLQSRASNVRITCGERWINLLKLN